jgi:hypothetical protein
MCTSRLRIRGMDAHQQARGVIVHSKLRRRVTDVHQQAKEEKDGYAPAG